MTIMTRVIRIFRADLHGVMDQIEDKELLLKQYLRELEIDLQNKEERTDQLADSIRLIQADQNKCRQEMDHLGRDIACAITREKDDIARLLIRKKRARLKQSDWLTSRQESLQEEHDRLAGLLTNQKLRYDTLKVQVETFHSRHRAATVDRPGSAGSPVCKDSPICGDEEIELELLQRKEQLREKGGKPC